MRGLTPQQQQYVVHRAEGHTACKSARLAGVSHDTGYKWEKLTHIQCAIADCIAQKDAIQHATANINSMEPVVFTSAERITQQAIATCAPKLVEKGMQRAEELYDTIIDLGLNARSEKVRLDAAIKALEIMGMLQRVTSIQERSIVKPGLSKEDVMEMRRQLLGVPGEAIEIDEVSPVEDKKDANADTNGSTDASV